MTMRAFGKAIGNIYFFKPVGLDGPIKIGFSHRPIGRLAQYASWSPVRLEMIGFVPAQPEDENFLHQCFADIHSHNEWFFATTALRLAIARILAVGSIAIARETLFPVGNIRTGRTNRSPEQRRKSSYAHRLSWATRKLRKETPDQILAFSEPAEIRQIMDRWNGNHRAGAASRPPSPAEIARLDDYLANAADQAKRHVIPRLQPAKAGVA